jgi:cell division protein FtsZ
MEGAIRVSVVATGIDATAANRAEPVATRRGAVAASPIPAFVPPAPVEPRRAEVPLTVSVAAAPASVQPAPMQSAPARQEPDLFGASEQHDDVTEDAGDALPPPAYRPQQQMPRTAPVPPRAAATAPAPAGADSYVAPRPRAAGTPSPEALARLQAAVSKAPGARVPPAQPAAAPAKPAAERPRFGIGSLINRMAGAATGSADPQPAPRQQPPVSAYDDEPEMNADQERIEIPAFLRRQAN